MKNSRLLLFLRDEKFIVALILSVFFLKGVFLVTLQPIFSGQDETRHYSTMQLLAEPKDSVSDSEKNRRLDSHLSGSNDDLSRFNYSEEIQKTASVTNTDLLRSDIYKTIVFSENYNGKNESLIDAKTWKPYNYYAEPNSAGGGTLYHKIGAQLEKLFADQTILVRFYLIRIFSVLLGTLAVFFCYLTAKTIGFSPKTSLILTALLSLQPKFSLYFTNINYDVLLIPMFFLFIYAGALTLKKGLDWKNLSLLLGSMIIAILAKPTGYILIVAFAALIASFFYEKTQSYDKRFRYSVYGICSLAFLFVTIYLCNRFLMLDDSLSSTINSVSTYLSKTMSIEMFFAPSTTYWGILSWTNSWFLEKATNVILIVQIVAVIGLGILCCSKKEYPKFLPEKKYVFFLIGMIIMLQLGIRAADWSSFAQLGSKNVKMSLGTPGRYFLPNLSAHILLIGIGLGALLAYFKKEKYFEPTLLILLILLFSLTTYLIFNAIILRFYF